VTLLGRVLLPAGVLGGAAALALGTLAAIPFLWPDVRALMRLAQAP